MAPFQSESQRRFLWAKHPKIAKKWSSEHGTPKNLPKHKDSTMSQMARKKRSM